MDTTIAELTNGALQTPTELEESRLIGYPSWTRSLQTNPTNGLAECVGDDVLINEIQHVRGQCECAIPRAA